MGQPPQSYLYQSMWINDGAPWQPPEVITLRDEAGIVIGSNTMATMVLTLYNVLTDTIVNGLDGTVDVKNARDCTLTSQGIFTLKLSGADTAILDPAQAYELRRALIQFTWPMTPTKSDCLEITFIVKNIHRRPT